MSEPLEIELGDSGLIAWIDEEDEQLAGMLWTAKRAGYAPNFHYYAINRNSIRGVSMDLWLHNLVWERMIGEPLPRGFLVDHINGDKLDNRRENLRLATRADNEANKKKRRTQAGGAPSSKYKGVNEIKDGRKKKWRAIVTVDKKHIRLGNFYTEIEAARAYNEAALEHYGEFAYINRLPEDGTEK